MAIATRPALQTSAARIRRVTLWQPGQAPQEIAPDHPRTPGAVRWIDVELTEPFLDEADRERATADLLDVLTPLCDSEIDAEMVLGLFNISDKREGQFFGEGRVRLVSACLAEAQRAADHDAGGRLLMHPLELLAGEGWFISCWHTTRVYDGARLESRDGAPPDGAAQLKSVKQRWARGCGRTAADLGTLFLYELAISYSPTYRTVWGWLEEWELDLYRTNQADGDRLERLWETMAKLREWVNPLNRMGLDTDIERGWFSGATEHDEVIRTDKRIDRVLEGLRELADTLRASFALLHARRQEEERDHREGLQRRLELLATAFLVPTLVIGIFGVNTNVPGERTWWGFYVLLGLLVLVSAIAVYTVLTLQRRRERQRRLDDAPPEPR